MARVKLPMGITSISGKLGNVCFRTMKGSGKVFMTRLPKARKTEVRPKEILNRRLFARRAQIVVQLRKAGAKLSTAELWKIVSQAV